MRADMVYINYGLAEKAWEKIQKLYKQHLINNPICEVCHTAKANRITPLGKIMSICYPCLIIKDKELEESYIVGED